MGVRVLIVDDHASFATFARLLLSADGFDVVGTAADGAGAISASRDLRPDVVLLDVQLPDADGFGVAEALAREPWVPAVVLVSSRAQSDYGRQVAASSARGFIGKADLSGDAVRRVVAAPQQPPSPAPSDQPDPTTRSAPGPRSSAVPGGTASSPSSDPPSS